MNAIKSIDLNCDLGEGAAYDADIMPLISSANIACGGHAGDTSTIRSTIAMALKHCVAIGAHPGYEDLEHFGRRPMHLPPEEISDLVARQLELFTQIAREFGAEVHHVKAHGALYTQADADPLIAKAIISTISRLLPHAMVYAPPGGFMISEAKSAGLIVRREGFVDRRYRADRSLVPRDQPGAVIDKVDDASNQAMGIVLNRSVTSADGNLIPIEIDTLCIHGDSAHAVEILLATRRTLEAAGVSVCR